MIKVNGLYHSYSNDDNYAVKNASFQIEKGEIFGFLGPSGAGKSTAQKILTGLLIMQQGDYTIDGKFVDFKKRDYFNKIGVSFEHPNVYKKLTGLENLEFHSGMYDVKTEDPMNLLRMVGLEEAAGKKASDYSKGMLQRLVFARAMINNPEIWFLDEPTSGLDPTTASRIKDIIKRKKEDGTTVFLTTHNMYIADELCDKVAFINEGEINIIDTPKNLKLKYGKKLVTVEYYDNDRIVNNTFSIVDEAERTKLNEIINKGNIATMHSQEATLEQIFIKVTGRGLE